MATHINVKALRIWLGQQRGLEKPLSQQDFGAEFGVDQTTIHRWETKQRTPRGPAKVLLDAMLAQMRAAKSKPSQEKINGRRQA